MPSSKTGACISTTSADFSNGLSGEILLLGCLMVLGGCAGAIVGGAQAVVLRHHAPAWRWWSSLIKISGVLVIGVLLGPLTILGVITIRRRQRGGSNNPGSEICIYTATTLAVQQRVAADPPSARNTIAILRLSLRCAVGDG